MKRLAPTSRRALFVLTTAALLTTAAAQQGTRGTVNAAIETVSDPLKAATDLEQEALQTASAASFPLSEPVAAALQSKLEQSIAKLDEAAAAVLGVAGGLKPSAKRDLPAFLGDAQREDRFAMQHIDRGHEQSYVTNAIAQALLAKARAGQALQRRKTGAKFAKANDPGRFARPGLPSDADIQREGKDGFTPSDAEGGSATDATKKQEKYPGKSKFQLPPDHYIAFRATKGTQAGGFVVLQRGNDMRGPFQATVTAGAFTAKPKALAALGDAFACFEFDVKGSSPLEFLSVCARPTDGGVQVFASARSGNLGQAFFPGTNVAVLDVVYDGTTFTCSAGTSHFSLTQFATFTRPQGTDIWTLGVGGAGLGGKAEVGIDDFAVWPITR